MKYVLAPLAGFTDAPFRRMCAEGGADLVYTEMVSAAGLAHGSSPTRQLLETMPGEGPVACQIFGAAESDIACAARFIEDLEPRTSDGRRETRFAELNLNAGCPMKKVTSEGAGAKLIEDPGKIHRLIKAMVENTSLPVTLKTRLGPHPQETRIFEILDAAESAGAKGIVVHARYTSQMHGGPVHFDVLREVVERAKIPVTGNGTVYNETTLAEMGRTGVSSVMIGRAALANPGVFGDFKRGTRPEDPDFRVAFFRRHLDYILRFRDQLATRFPGDHVPSPDAFASVKMHVHLFRYFNGRPGAAELRRRLNTVRTLGEIEDVVRGILPKLV